MVDIAVEQVFHLMHVSYSINAKCLLRADTIGNNTKGFLKKKFQSKLCSSYVNLSGITCCMPALNHNTNLLAYSE